MKLTFLGTRGNIEPRSRRHRRHSALMVEHRGRRIMLDCGRDWLGRVETAGRGGRRAGHGGPSPGREGPALQPDAIAITHGHPDHIEGLREGVSCPVYAPEQAWKHMERYPIADRRTIPLRRRVRIGGVSFTAFPVEHSTRCPAVCYRITAGGATFIYAPDVLDIPNAGEAMKHASLYIGDGASPARAIVRRAARDPRPRSSAARAPAPPTGHASIRTQLDWCRDHGVHRVIITHCGKQIVGGDEKKIARQLTIWADKRSLDVRIAHDGLKIEFPRVIAS